MTFNREKLRQYLRESGISQDDLALLAGKNVRTIRRWLSPNHPLTHRSIRQICDALGVAPEQFDPEANGIDTAGQSVQIGARVSVAAANGYTVLKKQFGITHKQLIEIAPVIFSIIARRAMTLSTRLEVELEDAVQELQFTNVDVDIDPFGEHQRKIDLARASEEKGWLFGEERQIENYNWHEQPTNLFCTELNELSKELTEVKRFSDLEGCPTSIGFQFSASVIDEITCGDATLKDLIRLGEINLGMMEDHLWQPKNNTERKSWLQREAHKSTERRRLRNTARRRAHPVKAKARAETAKRIQQTRKKLAPINIEPHNDGGQ